MGSVTAPAPTPVDPTARWYAVAAELREHAGQWRLVATCDTRGAAKSLARDIRLGRRCGVAPGGAYTARASGCEVHARHVGAAAGTDADGP